MIAVLHTWGQTLTHHPHVHCVVPGGGLAPDGLWVGCRPNFFLHVRVLSRLYRRLFLQRLQAAFEFRHVSWMDAEVFARLRARNLALCVADSEKFSTPVELTADYGYFRLRDEGYSAEDLTRWAGVIRERAAACRDVFVYFKHEEAGKGPQFARTLLQALNAPAA